MFCQLVNINVYGYGSHGIYHDYDHFYLMALLQEINEQGKTIVVITHESDIANMCKRIVYLRDGVIVEDKKIKQKKAKDYVE